MKRLFIIALSVMLVFESCSRGLTPYEAASGRQKCGRGYIK